MKYNTEWFVNKAIGIHGDLFDYSLVDYINSITKVKIICKVHGVFEQVPNDHTSHKNGCPVCGKLSQIHKVTLAQTEIISKFNEKWNFEYDYSKFIYSGTFGKGIIICKKHGEFTKSATSHLSGVGCGECAKESISYVKDGKEVVHITKSVFLEKAKEKHNDRFTYPNLIYVDANTNININCTKHNLNYLQTPILHLRSNGGCKKCKSESIHKAHSKDTEQFIEEALNVHKNHYSYPLSDYKGNKVKLKINCPLHGEFLQKPNDHLGGHGCGKCGSEDGSTYNITKAIRNKEKWLKVNTELYLIELKSKNESFIKIGISSNKSLRHSIIERDSKCTIVDSLIAELDLYSAVIIEQTILKENKEYRYLPINNFAGYTECFNIVYKKYIENKIQKFLEKDLHN